VAAVGAIEGGGGVGVGLGVGAGVGAGGGVARLPKAAGTEGA
jgi:hypothetical protein